MHQESNCIHGMIQIWYDVQKISLEHDQCFFIQMLFFMKKLTTPSLLFTLGV